LRKQMLGNNAAETTTGPNDQAIDYALSDACA